MNVAVAGIRALRDLTEYNREKYGVLPPVPEDATDANDWMEDGVLYIRTNGEDSVLMSYHVKPRDRLTRHWAERSPGWAHKLEYGGEWTECSMGVVDKDGVFRSVSGVGAPITIRRASDEDIRDTLVGLKPDEWWYKRLVEVLGTETAERVRALVAS